MVKWKNLNIAKIVSAIVVCQLAGVAGSIFTFSSIPTWYATLNKPAFSPPNWLFGPAWITLYTLMGISLYLVWSKGLNNKKVKDALKFFSIQLVLNSFWTIIFFGLRNPFAAFVEIIFLWASIAFTIFSFYKISRTAAYLLVPYIIWVSFAAALNYYVWILNL
jgi:tryptophan-rich sensory protein